MPSWISNTYAYTKPLREYIKRKGKRFRNAEIAVRAAALAYHTLLGIVPVVGMVFWYLTSLAVFDQWLEVTKTFIMEQLNIVSSETFALYFEKLTTTVSGESWGWIGLAVLVYTVYNLIARFGESLDLILETSPNAHLKKRTRLPVLGRRLVVMIGLPITLVLSLVVTQFIRSDSLFHYIAQVQWVGPLVALPLAWVATILSCFFVYWLVPRTPVRWTQALKAACVVGPMSELLKFLFGLYNRQAVAVHKIYGVLAAVPMFVLWVQFAWMLLLGGALLIEFKHRKV